MADGQGALALAAPRQGAPGFVDFLVSESNAAAARAVAAPARWPEGRLALVGPPASGKTLLARRFMAETGAARAEAARLRAADVPALLEAGAAVVEDVHRVGVAAGRPESARDEAERALFHLLNLAAAERRPVLLTGRAAPARWKAALPDLASRLAALTVARLDPPDDALLEAVIARLFAERALAVEPGLPAYLARRIERSFAAAAEAVARLDAASLAAKRRPTRRLAAEALDI